MCFKSSVFTFAVPLKTFPLIEGCTVFIRKNEEHVDWNFMFSFACGHMAALNTEIRLWGFF
jgi:hypothetical protein